VRDRKQWVQQDEPHDGPWAAQVVRSNIAARCAVAPQLSAADARPLTDALPQGSEATVLEMYRQAIDLADRFIYIENQYLIGSGQRWQTPRTTIANDLPERLVNKIIAKKGHPFHVYVVTPLFPEGDPVGTGGVEVRNYEWRTIEYMVRALEAGIGEDWRDYLSLLFLAHWEQVPQSRWSRGDRNARLRAHQRYMVYVHSKMMIVDDRFLILGSANLNERSLAGGRDTEIACTFWPGRDQERVCIDKLRGFRKELWREHYGTVPVAADDPASAACVNESRQIAEANYLSFRSLRAQRQGHICYLPVSLTGGGLAIGRPKGGPDTRVVFPEPADYLPDGDPRVDWWQWTCRGSRLSARLGDLAE
jgi:phospholipase D1/2